MSKQANVDPTYDPMYFLTLSSIGAIGLQDDNTPCRAAGKAMALLLFVGPMKVTAMVQVCKTRIAYAGMPASDVAKYQYFLDHREEVLEYLGQQGVMRMP